MDEATRARLEELTRDLVSSQEERKEASEREQAEKNVAQQKEEEMLAALRREAEKKLGREMTEGEWLDFIGSRPEREAGNLVKEKGGWKIKGGVKLDTQKDFR